MKHDHGVNPAKRVLGLLRRHGVHATSFQILESGYTYWFDEDAVIAYVRQGRWFVVAGVPICPLQRQGEVAARFVAFAAQQRCGALFFSADAPFIDQLRAQKIPLAQVKIGEQPEWDPAGYTTEGPKRRSLRAQINRARNKGVTVERVQADTAGTGALRAQVQIVLDRWQAARKMSAMHFMVDLQPFSLPAERRYYVATHQGRAVGFLAAIPVYQRRGWFFEDVIRVPDAPNGTTELLIHTAMLEARTQGDDYVTLGLAPLAGVESGPGPNRLLRACFSLSWKHLGPLYLFPGLYRFKARFMPDRWAPQYLVASPPALGLTQLHAVLAAFAGGGLITFGADSVRRWLTRAPGHRWAAMVWSLAGLLVPWTLLLAQADGDRWFGDASIQMAWVAFDCAMVGALGLLGWSLWRGWAVARTGAIFLAGATGTDFVLTLAQVLHLHQQATGVSAVFVGAGVLGPLLATVLLSAIAWSRAGRC